MLGERRLQIQQWGELWLACESFLYEVLALPFVIKLVTVLEGVVENPRNNQMHIYPNLLGQIRTTLPARFSIVAQSFVADFEGKRYHCLSSHSHPKIESKDRYGKGRTWLDPKMANILQYMEGKAKEETELEKKIGIGL